MFWKKKKTIVVHSGNFHPDDIFAVAVLRIVLEDKYKIKIIRTRDEEIINKADYVVDVGMVYDKEKNRLIDYLIKTQQLGATYFEDKESHSFGKDQRDPFEGNARPTVAAGRATAIGLARTRG